MENDYPTEEELQKIREWTYEDNGFFALAEYVCNLWHFDDWATYRDWATDEYGRRYRELRLATAGWSGNESIISALDKNTMFNMLCWQSSHRGGLHIYHVPDLLTDKSV